MKSIAKLFLVVILFSSVALADGSMTGGGRSCNNGSGNPECCTNGTGCGFADDGSMTGGGKAKDDGDQGESILIIIEKYLISLFG